MLWIKYTHSKLLQLRYLRNAFCSYNKLFAAPKGPDRHLETLDEELYIQPLLLMLYLQSGNFCTANALYSSRHYYAIGTRTPIESTYVQNRNWIYLVAYQFKFRSLARWSISIRIIFFRRTIVSTSRSYWFIRLKGRGLILQTHFCTAVAAGSTLTTVRIYAIKQVWLETGNLICIITRPRPLQEVNFKEAK